MILYNCLTEQAPFILRNTSSKVGFNLAFFFKGREPNSGTHFPVWLKWKHQVWWPWIKLQPLLLGALWSQWSYCKKYTPNGEAQAPICSSKGGLACLIDPVVGSCSYFILLNRCGIFLLWLPKDSWCEPFIVPNKAIVLISVKICGLKQRWDLTALFPV